ncbi:MAG: STAS domain-containing protein [Patescibacteria group bacterium]
MPTNLKITVNEVEPNQDYQIIKFDGEFDKAGHSEIKEQLDKIVLNFNLKALIFDFNNLKFINSEGIGYLMEIHTHLVQRDRKLVIIGPNSHVKDVFTTIGIAEIVPIYNELNDFLNK